MFMFAGKSVFFQLLLEIEICYVLCLLEDVKPGKFFFWYRLLSARVPPSWGFNTPGSTWESIRFCNPIMTEMLPQTCKNYIFAFVKKGVFPLKIFLITFKIGVFHGQCCSTTGNTLVYQATPRLHVSENNCLGINTSCQPLWFCSNNQQKYYSLSLLQWSLVYQYMQLWSGFNCTRETA